MGKMTNQYIAGFFDGDGCVMITKGGNYVSENVQYRIVVKIAQKGYCKALESLQKKYGGSLRRGGSGGWTICCRKAIRFLKDISPYSIGKREQIKFALKCGKRLHGCKRKPRLTKRELRKREEMKQKLSRMKSVNY